MMEDVGEVVPDRRFPPAFERRDGDLVDQLAEERRLRQDLDVHERRCRLQGDGPELLAPMEPAGRVDVLDRHREDEPPGEPAEPARQPHGQAILARADDVIAMVDRLEQGIEVGRGPGLARRGHEHERRDGPLEPPGDRLMEVEMVAHDDDALDVPSTLRDQLLERPGHARVRGPVVRGQHDDPDGGTRHRVAAEVGFERVEELINGRGHSASAPKGVAALGERLTRRGRLESDQTGWGASQRSTAAR
jgi:hypothetical protein